MILIYERKKLHIKQGIRQFIGYLWLTDNRVGNKCNKTDPTDNSD